MSSARPPRHRRPRHSRIRRTASLALAGAALGGTVLSPLDAAAAPLTVLRGHRLVTSVPGFAPGAVVALRLDRVVDVGTSRADRTGTVHVTMSAPTTLGRHQLMLVGAIPSTRSAVAAAGGAADGDAQAIVVVVPRLVSVTFRVVPSLGVDADQTDRNHSRDGHDGTSHNGTRPDVAGESVTADTGTNVLLPGLIGCALVVLGAAVMFLGRRRSVRPR